nr:hypothetical protein [Tanacetum cinerariifolium]
MVEPEMPLKKKAQISLDEKLAFKLQAKQEEEEERIAREKALEANEEDQEELTIEEKSRLFVEFMDKRKKHFAKLRAEEKRRKPPTNA